MSILISNLIILSSLSFAVGERTDVHTLKESESKIDWRSSREVEPEVRLAKPRPRRVRRGNLPLELVRRRSSNAAIDPSEAIKYPELGPINRSGMDVGDVFDCIIEQDIKAYSGSKAPVRARILSGPKKGRIFVGNAVMDPNTKNILVWFDLVRNLESGRKHKLLASIHSSGGEVGLVGTHHSKYWSHFFATVLARAAEGYAQASVERNQNLFGNFQQVPNQENAGKVAVASAASETANVVSREIKNLPEYASIRGPIRAQVFITEKPTLTN